MNVKVSLDEVIRHRPSIVGKLTACASFIGADIISFLAIDVQAFRSP